MGKPGAEWAVPVAVLDKDVIAIRGLYQMLKTSGWRLTLGKQWLEQEEKFTN